MTEKLKSPLSTNSKSIWYWISSKLADSLIASLMVFQITHEIKFNLTCEWLSNSAVHFIGIKIWPAIPCSNFFSYWLFFPSFFRNKKSNWFVVVDFKCVYGRDFPIFLFPWNENTTTKSISSTRCCHISFWHSAWLFFFFNNCWYKMCCRAKLIWQQRAFKSSVILLDFLKIKTQLTLLLGAIVLIGMKYEL